MTTARDSLHPPEMVVVETLDDHTSSARCDQGFLTLRRLTLQNRYPDGRLSAPYRYDLVERAAMDAVGIVLFAEGERGPEVCLRSALRPPLTFRSGYALPLAESTPASMLWEVPAGLIEPDEQGEAGIRRCAARETMEEVGLRVAPDDFEPLGPPACLSPGVMAEKLHFLVARVDPGDRGTPTADGSPVEEHAQVSFVPIEEALAATRDGRLADVKTEVAIHRLKAWLEAR